MTRVTLWILLAAGAATLSACSTVGPPARGAGPAAAGMKWNYDDSLEGQYRLAFGVPETDAVGLILACGDDKKGQVIFSTSLQRGRAGMGEVHLRSGKLDKRYRAKVRVLDSAEGWDATGALTLPDPVMSAFEKTGRISQVEDQDYPQDARSDAERADIRRFFGVCRG